MKKLQKCCSKMYWELRPCRLGLLSVGFTVACSSWIISLGGIPMSISLGPSFGAHQILQKSLPVFCLEAIGLAFSILRAELRKKTDGLNIQYVKTLLTLSFWYSTPSLICARHAPVEDPPSLFTLKNVNHLPSTRAGESLNKLCRRIVYICGGRIWKSNCFLRLRQSTLLLLAHLLSLLPQIPHTTNSDPLEVLNAI